MKKILLSLLLLTLYAPVAAESAEGSVYEKIPYKNLIMGAIYLKKYTFAQEILTQNELTDADKAEVQEFCKNYIYNLEEKKKTHNAALKTLVNETIISSCMFLLCFLVAREQKEYGQKDLAVQERCINVDSTNRDNYLANHLAAARGRLDHIKNIFHQLNSRYDNLWKKLSDTANALIQQKNPRIKDSYRACQLSSDYQSPVIFFDENPLSVADISSEIDLATYPEVAMQVRNFIIPLNREASSRFDTITRGVAGIGILNFVRQLSAILGECSAANIADADITEVTKIKSLLTGDASENI